MLSSILCGQLKEAGITSIASLSELINACGDNFESLRSTKPYLDAINKSNLEKLSVKPSWIATRPRDIESNNQWVFVGNTPEEAVAKLFLYSKKCSV